MKRLLSFGVFAATLFCGTSDLAAQISPKPLPLTAEQIAQYRKDLRSGARSDRSLAITMLALARDSASVLTIANEYSEPWQSWPAASWALGVIKGNTARDILLRRSGDPDYGRYVIPALGEFKDTMSYNALVGLLQSTDVHSRAAAATALGNVGNPKAIDALLPLLNDSLIATAVKVEGVTWGGDRTVISQEVSMTGVAVRGAALAALVQLNDRRALAPLAARLASEPNEKFRASLAEAVEKLNLAPMPKTVTPKPAAKPKPTPKPPVKHK